MNGLGIIVAFNPRVREPFAGKTALEWTIHALRYNRYINEIKVVGNDTKTMALVESMTKDYGCSYVDHSVEIGETIVDWVDAAIAAAKLNPLYHYFVLVNPSYPLLMPGDIDRICETLHADPIHYHQTSFGMEDLLEGDIESTLAFASDTLRWKTTLRPEGGEPKTLAAALAEVHRTKVPVEAWQKEIIYGENCESLFRLKVLDGKDDPYKAHYEAMMTETGFKQTATLYNKGVENNLLPQDYRSSHINHFRIWAEFSPHDPKGEIAEYHLVEKHADGNMKTVNVIRAHSAKPISARKLEVPEPALIVGSGRSLNDLCAVIKNWKGAVFCSTSQASTLQHAGHHPRYIMAYDVMTGPEELSDVESPLWEGGSTLISHPGMNPLLLDYWQGDKLYFRELDSMNMYFGRILPIAYPYITDEMYLFSCSLTAQMSVASAMGYSPLILAGCDFGASRYDRWKYIKGEWTCTKGVEYLAQATGGASGNVHAVIKADNGEWTRPMNVFYKRSVLCVWRIDRSQCLMTSPKSIITEMPQVPLDKVIEGQGRGLDLHYLSEDAIIDRAETYLAKVNQFFVRYRAGGLKVVEVDANDWEGNLRNYMGAMTAMMARQGDQGQSIDIDWNIEHIRGLRRAAGWTEKTPVK